MDMFRPQQAPQPTELKARMSMLRQMMQGDPSQIISNLRQTNPQFARFEQQMQGKTPEEAFKAFGYDLNEVMSIINTK